MKLQFPPLLLSYLGHGLSADVVGQNDGYGGDLRIRWVCELDSLLHTETLLLLWK